jgi:hypothetical protein
MTTPEQPLDPPDVHTKRWPVGTYNTEDDHQPKWDDREDYPYDNDKETQ